MYTLLRSKRYKEGKAMSSCTFQEATGTLLFVADTTGRAGADLTNGEARGIGIIIEGECIATLRMRGLSSTILDSLFFIVSAVSYTRRRCLWCVMMEVVKAAKQEDRRLNWSNFHER
jgi:hypothetical protein